MQSGKKHGMQTMNDALYQLYTNREVAQEECERVSHEPKEFLRMIGMTPMEDQEIASADGNKRAAAPTATPSLNSGDSRMPMFEYTARNAATGQIQKGQLDAPSKDDVSTYLRKNRLILVNVREAPKQIKLSLGKASA